MDQSVSAQLWQSCTVNSLYVMCDSMQRYCPANTNDGRNGLKDRSSHGGGVLGIFIYFKDTSVLDFAKNAFPPLEPKLLVM